MDSLVFVAILGAAFLHAGWNAVVKNAGDKSLSMAAVVAGHTPVALVTLLFVAMPDARSAPYGIASAILHCGYQYFLLWAYRIGDMSHVYPIARGTAPVLVTIIALLFLDEKLSTPQVLSIALIAAGIMSLLLLRSGTGWRNPKAGALALATSAFIAGYTLIDGLGARVSGSPVGFYCWSTILNSFLFTAFSEFLHPGTAKRVVTSALWAGLAGGTASFGAYAIAVWAFAHAPIPVVAALREISIIAALFIGVIFLREHWDRAKVVATAITTCGVILLRLVK